MTIDGHEVGDSYVSLPSLGSVLYKVPPDIDWTPKRGDRFRIVAEYVIDDIGHPLKHNKQGVATEAMRQVISTTPVVPDEVTIAGVMTAEQVEAAWDAAHAGQQETG
jgi:hypothetical protein